MSGAYRTGAVRSGRCDQDLYVNWSVQSGKSRADLGRQVRVAMPDIVNGFQESAELMAGGNAEETDAMIAFAKDDDRGNLVDAVFPGQIRFGHEIVYLSGDLL